MQHLPEKIAKIWAAYGGPKSASAVGDAYDMTRNAVIGIWHRCRVRNGIAPRPPKPRDLKPRDLIRAERNARRRARRATKRTEKAKGAISVRPAPLIADIPEIAPAPIPASAIPFRLLTDRTCHFPLGGWNEPAELFCGGPSVWGQPYCQFHMSVAYRPVERRGR